MAWRSILIHKKIIKKRKNYKFKTLREGSSILSVATIFLHYHIMAQQGRHTIFLPSTYYHSNILSVWLVYHTNVRP